MLKAELKVIGGKHHGRVIPLTTKKFLVGREPDCHLRPNSESVSRHHCAFTLDDYTCRIRDLGSTNGTFVNGRRISGYQQLKSHDRVTIGKLAFEVIIYQHSTVDELDSQEAAAHATVLSDTGAGTGESPTTVVAAVKEGDVPETSVLEGDTAFDAASDQPQQESVPAAATPEPVPASPAEAAAPAAPPEAASAAPAAQPAPPPPPPTPPPPPAYPQQPMYYPQPGYGQPYPPQPYFQPPMPQPYYPPSPYGQPPMPGMMPPPPAPPPQAPAPPPQQAPPQESAPAPPSGAAPAPVKLPDPSQTGAQAPAAPSGDSSASAPAKPPENPAADILKKMQNRR